MAEAALQAKDQRYDPHRVESEVLALWERERTFQKAREQVRGKKPFYYLDGPPYTSGAIHIGHAWGKALRDSLMRYKRMRGFDVWDQPGFDVHGLPIEVAVEKKLGIEDKKDIIAKLGVEKFIDACRKFAIEQMLPMCKDFARLGVWMDWERPYLTLTNEYIEGAWWALAEADRRGYLARGHKSMTWCPRCSTALAKHELDYFNEHDESIFVKFPLAEKEREYLIVWTTTPWTIPFNLAVMAHPDIAYVRAKVGDEIWIMAKALANSLISGLAGKRFTVQEEVKGKYLEGVRYRHPFRDEIKAHREYEKERARAYTVVLSERYVTLDAGTGLVHCAPGCGAEDFEVGTENDLPAFNTVDDSGVFPKEMGPFAGLRARKDDAQFARVLKDRGLLVATSEIDHEYAHCWRCKNPVIYKATPQWFLLVENLKEEMLEANRHVTWVPEWAGSRWFDSWLRNLQNWCISRQRFWGIPLPIWLCSSCGEYRLVSSKKELEEVSGQKLEDLHRPWIDRVTLKCRCGKVLHRVEDVLDVWLDSGAASWAPLGYPTKTKLFEKFWPADFILEGKDQIRGWFNSMMCLSMVSHGKIPYKAVYMHGFTNDAQGRKMSKSLKNIISPEEVIEKYGADTLRYYFIGGANPGLDINYNFEDMGVRFRNLGVLWNLMNFLLDHCAAHDIKPCAVTSLKGGGEERYILSKLHTTMEHVSTLFDSYRLNEVPDAIEELYLELSRTYLQLVREKSASGSEEEKQLVADTAFTVLLGTIFILAPVAPFITEAMFQRLKAAFHLKGESVHLQDWPKPLRELMDPALEQQMALVKHVAQAALACRDDLQLGVRWPLREAVVVTADHAAAEAVKELSSLLKAAINVREVRLGEVKTRIVLKPNFRNLGPAFKQLAPKVAEALAAARHEDLASQLSRGKASLKVGKEEVTLLPDHVLVQEQLPEGYMAKDFPAGKVFLSSEIPPELEDEGFAREVMRRVQALRKEAGLRKSDRITLAITAETSFLSRLDSWKERIAERTGAKECILGPAPVGMTHRAEHEVRGKTFTLAIAS